MTRIYKFWFRPDLAEAIARRYSHITLNKMLSFQKPSPEIREMWESTELDELGLSAVHLGAEPNQPPGAKFQVQVVQVMSNAPTEAVIQLFQDLSGLYLNSVAVPE